MVGVFHSLTWYIADAEDTYWCSYRAQSCQSRRGGQAARLTCQGPCAPLRLLARQLRHRGRCHCWRLSGARRALEWQVAALGGALPAPAAALKACACCQPRSLACMHKKWYIKAVSDFAAQHCCSSMLNPEDIRQPTHAETQGTASGIAAQSHHINSSIEGGRHTRMECRNVTVQHASEGQQLHHGAWRKGAPLVACGAEQAALPAGLQQLCQAGCIGCLR